MNAEPNQAPAAVACRPTRQRRARIHLRLSASERTELENAARAAGYARLTTWLLDRVRGEASARVETDALLAQTGAVIEASVRASVEGAIAAQAVKSTADLAALAGSVERLREAFNAAFLPMSSSLKALASKPAAGPVSGSKP